MGPFISGLDGAPLTLQERLRRMSDSGLQDRADILALRLLDAWRAGERSPRAVGILARVAGRFPRAGLLTGQERHELGIDP
ncbi:MAG: hypothetical protein WD960_15080 [Gemmatimonadota bacterium]